MPTAEEHLAYSQNLISNVKLPLFPSYTALTYRTVWITPINFSVDTVDAACSTQSPASKDKINCYAISGPIPYRCFLLDPVILRPVQTKEMESSTRYVVIIVAYSPRLYAHQLNPVQDADPQGHERLREVNNFLSFWRNGEACHSQICFLQDWQRIDREERGQDIDRGSRRE